jgi:hypothetical protein
MKLNREGMLGGSCRRYQSAARFPEPQSDTPVPVADGFKPARAGFHLGLTESQIQQ